MEKNLKDAIGAAAAEAVNAHPTLAFTYMVGLKNTESPKTFAQLDTLFQEHGGYLSSPDTSSSLVFVLPQSGAQALLNHELTTSFNFLTENSEEGLRAVRLGPSGRTYNSMVSVPSKVPYYHTTIPD